MGWPMAGIIAKFTMRERGIGIRFKPAMHPDHAEIALECNSWKRFIVTPAQLLACIPQTGVVHRLACREGSVGSLRIECVWRDPLALRQWRNMYTDADCSGDYWVSQKAAKAGSDVS